MSVFCRLLLLSILAVATVGAAAHAQGRPDRGQGQGQGREQARPERAERRAAPQSEPPARLRSQDAMADSIRHIRNSTHGQVLSAERMHSNGREINRIKVVDDRGRVRVYEDDPQQRRQRSRRDDD